MKVIPLGTNGFFPSFGRATACYAIPLKDKLIILDAGSGLFRLAEQEGKELLRGKKEVHLYLSHYHLDHTFGFYAAFKLLKGKKVTVLAESGRQVFWEFVTMKHFPINYSKVHKNFSWQAISEGNHKISSYQVSVRKQDHRGEGSLAFRFSFQERSALGRKFELAYVTDSEPTKESIEFVRGVPLLLHEHGFVGKTNIKLNKQIIDGHVTTIGATLLAKEAKVGKLALIHHYPFADDKKLASQLKIARSIFPKTILAKDLEMINF